MRLAFHTMNSMECTTLKGHEYVPFYAALSNNWK